MNLQSMSKKQLIQQLEGMQKRISTLEDVESKFHETEKAIVTILRWIR